MTTASDNTAKKTSEQIALARLLMFQMEQICKQLRTRPMHNFEDMTLELLLDELNSAHEYICNKDGIGE